MSIAINSNFERDQLVAAPAQTIFVYSFPVFDETYLKVYQYNSGDTPDDATQLLTLGADYTVTGVGAEAGGTIILTVPATSGDIITIVGAEPIDRLSVFPDLNPFTVAMNQQLNELTVMIEQVYTYWANITPHYNFDELVSTTVRPLKRILPMLPDGHVWVGRGALNVNPDDIITMPFNTAQGLNLIGGWLTVTIPTQLVVNTGYFSNGAVSITHTLPVLSKVGDVIIVYGMGPGGFVIAQNASQNIQLLGGVTTTGAFGSVTSTQPGACLFLVCNVANTSWVALTENGSFFIM